MYDLEVMSCITSKRSYGVQGMTQEMIAFYMEIIDDNNLVYTSFKEKNSKLFKPDFMQKPLVLEEEFKRVVLFNELLKVQDSYYYATPLFGKIYKKQKDEYNESAENENAASIVDKEKNRKNTEASVKKYEKIKNEKNKIRREIFEAHFKDHSPKSIISAKDANNILKQHARLLHKRIYLEFKKDFESGFSKRFKKRKSIHLYLYLIKYIRKFQIAENISLVRLEHIYRFRLSKLNHDETRENTIGIKDIGFGNQQILTMLLYITLQIDELDDDKYIVIEEPEANLHPDRQVDLVDMLINYQNAFGVKFLLETHSENILRRYQILIAKGKLRSDELKIVFFRKKGKSEIININDYGQITVPFGKHFYNKSSKQKLDLMNLLMKSKSNTK